MTQAVSQVIESSDELTPEWFGSLLGAEIEAVEIEPIGGGLIGRSARAQVTYTEGDGPASVVVKYATDDQGSFGLARAMRMYELEVLATPSQRASQMRWGSRNLPGRSTRASSSILMPVPAEE